LARRSACEPFTPNAWPVVAVTDLRELGRLLEMSAAERVLERLKGVRQTAPDRWIARCPAHEDNSPSLSVRETDDGRVLIYDFGGCEVRAVLDALGLTLGDLFERPLVHCSPPSRSRIPARDILEALAFEVSVATIIAHDILESRDIGELGWQRLAQACSRISSARVYCDGR
jgi:hypothetical protein